MVSNKYTGGNKSLIGRVDSKCSPPTTSTPTPVSTVINVLPQLPSHVLPQYTLQFFDTYGPPHQTIIKDFTLHSSLDFWLNPQSSSLTTQVKALPGTTTLLSSKPAPTASASAAAPVPPPASRFQHFKTTLTSVVAKQSLSTLPISDLLPPALSYGPLRFVQEKPSLLTILIRLL
ncbi:hypothetical protein CANARDRAFT_6053 [[Candida] arabinofermentans NRRL YB-2248]|uniref:Uncharacterized protein n=1 Tax=[Candida] arabinofermentans NRRL YB-2248 TaxID=983967 RepID=A0A1E4T704_9ASCO|nr:hypothetical protein CANARDRAFT_6053 [[Candida] arabinofermentans NRRL YB-2248]